MSYYTEKEIEDHKPDGMIPFQIERRGIIKAHNIVEKEMQEKGLEKFN